MVINSKVPLMMAVLMLSMSVIGCSKEEEQSTTTTLPATQPTPPPPPAQPPVGTNPSAPFSPLETPVARVNGGLIPPTASKQRRSQITPGRRDPYEQFETKATVVMPETRNTFLPPPVNSTVTPPPAPRPVSSASPKKGSHSSSSVVTSRPSKSQPPAPIIPPPPPVPEQAQGVTVSGIVQLGGMPIAILTIPGEPGTRHVRVGTVLADGVVVKSIDANARRPFIVLEQYGQKVIKEVGETPTASLP